MASREMVPPGRRPRDGLGALDDHELGRRGALAILLRPLMFRRVVVLEGPLEAVEFDDDDAPRRCRPPNVVEGPPRDSTFAPYFGMAAGVCLTYPWC